MTNPIYIIGNNSLAYYLGSQLQNGGHNVILLLDRGGLNNSLATEGIAIKEDRSLTQKRHQLEVSTLMKEPAKMVVITAFANQLNTMLSCVSASKIGAAPVVCFTPLPEMEYLAPLVGGGLHPAFFNGYVLNHKNTVSLLGRGTNITVCASEQGTINLLIADIFASARISVLTSDNHHLSFWEYFAPYALCSLLSAAENSKISDLMKNKDGKELIHNLVREFCALADADGITLNDSVILKGIYNTPANYIYPLHQAIISGRKDEFSLLSSTINNAALKGGLTIPQTKLLLKKLYNLISAPHIVVEES